MKSLRRILVTGHSGLLGSHVIRRLNGSYEIFAISRRTISVDVPVSQISIDMADSRALVDILNEISPEIIVNCAALSDVDRCQREPELARRINAESVARIANFCAAKSRLLIHISTDYVFDGLAGPYAEDAVPNPINTYGLTKLEAENSIIASGCAYIIVRTNHIYGSTTEGPSKLLRWILEAEKEGRSIKAASDQYNNPTWAGNLADSLVELINSAFRGVINFGGADYLSRYEFAILAAGALGISLNLVEKTFYEQLDLEAPRPLRAGLKVEKIRKLLKTSPYGVLEGLSQVKMGMT